MTMPAECLSCSYCSQEIRNFNCDHYFCNECLQIENENCNDCAKCLGGESLQEIPPKKIKAADEISCSERNCNHAFFSEEVTCEICSALYCTDCLDKHDEAMINKYFLPLKSMCVKHNLELTLFCDAYNCNSFMCKECATSHQIDHQTDIVPCNSKSEQCLTDLLECQQRNKQNMDDISRKISALRDKKILLVNKMNVKKSEFTTTRDNLIKLMNEKHRILFKMRKELIADIDEEIQELRNYQTDLKHAMQEDCHFPRNESRLKIIQLLIMYSNRKQHTFQGKNCITEFKEVDMKPSKHIPMQIRDALTNICCDIRYYINESAFPSVDDAYALPTIFKTKRNEFVEDVCYDSIKGNLYLLNSCGAMYRLLRILEGEVKSQFEVPKIITEIHSKPSIALLPDRSVLFLCNNRLELISNIEYLEVCTAIFEELTHVFAICTNPCVTETYAYYRGTDNSCYILKYKNSSVYTYIKLDLVEEPCSMRVIGDLDHIAFIAKNKLTIYFYSLNRGEKLYSFSNEGDTYNSGFFLSKKIFVVNVNSSVLTFIDFEKRENIRKIGNDGKKSLVQSLHLTTNCNSNTLFVCFCVDKHHHICKMIF